MNNLIANMPAPAPMVTPLLGRAIAPYPVPANMAIRPPNNVMIPSGIRLASPKKTSSKALLVITLFLGIGIGGVIVWKVRPWYDTFKRAKNLILED